MFGDQPGWTLKIRVWVERDGIKVLGPGRADLLELIHRLHSISAATGDRSPHLPESTIIRTAVTGDLPALCRLAEELVRRHVAFDPGRYQPPADVAAGYAELLGRHVGDPASVVVVADRAGELVGYAFGVVEPPSLVALAGRAGWIHDLYVSVGARRLGVGGLLLDTAVAGLRRIGCPGGVLLGVAAQNVAAEALFRSRGFRPTLQEMALGPWPAEDAEPNGTLDHLHKDDPTGAAAGSDG